MSAIEEILNHTDTHRQRCQSAFDEFQGIMDDAKLPQHLWPSDVQRIYNTLARRNSQAQRDFFRAHKSLSTQKPPKPPEPEPEPPKPKPVPTYRERLYRQSAEIRVIDGKCVTLDIDYSAKYFLSQTWNATAFVRTLCFEDGVVPEEYAYANTHDGETYPFATAVFIYYSPEEFLRLCQLEVDSNSPHLLDGERIQMERLTY